MIHQDRFAKYEVASDMGTKLVSLTLGIASFSPTTINRLITPTEARSLGKALIDAANECSLATLSNATISARELSDRDLARITALAHNPSATFEDLDNEKA